MSSSTGPGGHLEFREGDEIVFCHNPDCGHEWYRSQHESLECPQCGGEITEIIDRENDPRQDFALPPFLGGLGSPPPLFPVHDHSDSDPDEEDIASHLGRDGFFSRTTGRGPSLSSRPLRRSPGPDLSDPHDADAIMRRFHEMLVNDFRAPRPNDRDARDMFSGGPSGGDEDGPRIRTATYRGPFGGTTTFTIATGPLSSPGRGPAQFNTLFGNLMGDFGAPDPNNIGRPPAEVQGGAGGPPRVPQVGLAASLTEILQALLNPASAVRGDAVYSQEALDRIITTLMEANPQSNAAPPASQAALDSLQKKKVDDEMLGPDGKAECTICIDEIKKGDEVLMLPCKHWFHGECVTLWLKEHNTCPVCRTPIENRNAPGNEAPSHGAGPQGPSTPGAFPHTAPPQSSERERNVRSAGENLARLNALRNLAGLATDRDERDRDERNPANRRNSLSPQATRSYSENASRRERSPSASRDQNRQSLFGGRPRENSGGSGGQNENSRNPLSWLRNTFTRNRDAPDGGDQRRP